MANESASTFPSHKYDFGDRVFVLPLQASGVVEAIAYQCHDDTWHYRLTVLSHSTDRWWTQDELKHCSEVLACDCGGQPAQNVTDPRT